MSINSNGDLPLYFISKLENKNDIPLYKAFKGHAQLEISINAYEKAYLVKEIKINDVLIPMEANSYSIEKEINVTPDSPTPIKIEFV